MWVDLISGHDSFGQALVPRFTAAVADAVARAKPALLNGLREVAPSPRRPVSSFPGLLASPTSRFI